ncbi:MAG: hypothetical protein O3A60_04410 [Planctomycetota bacterium]|nr:hypothetical protein [Planctomycetota bacterium]
MASMWPGVVIEQLASPSSSAGIGHIRFYTLDRISDAKLLSRGFQRRSESGERLLATAKAMVEHHSRESRSPEPRPESVAVASSYSR